MPVAPAVTHKKWINTTEYVGAATFTGARQKACVSETCCLLSHSMQTLICSSRVTFEDSFA